MRKQIHLLWYSWAVVFVLKRELDQRDAISSLKLFGSMKLVSKAQFDSSIVYVVSPLDIPKFITIRPERSAVLMTLPMACEQQDLLLFFYMSWLPRPPGLRSHLLRSSSAEWLRVRWWSGDTSLCLGSATCQLWILGKDNNEDDNNNHNHNIRTYLIGLFYEWVNICMKVRIVPGL